MNNSKRFGTEEAGQGKGKAKGNAEKTEETEGRRTNNKNREMI